MFVVFLLRWFLGYVRFSGRGVFLEQFLSQCAREKINIWGITRHDEYVEGYILASSYRKLRHPAKKNGVRIRVKERHGLPFYLDRYHRRIGIAIGGAIFILVLTILSNFVWSFEVVGNERVSEEEILSALEEFGLSYGVYIPSVSVRKLEQQMLLKFDDLAWIAINLNSSVAEIRVHETVFPPQSQRNDDGLYNIVAAEAGQIKYMEVYVGQPVVVTGEAVKKGDLIVSGIIEDPKGNTLLRHARAKVLALVPFSETFEVNMHEEYTIDTGASETKYELSLFGWKIPLYFNAEPELSQYYTEESVIYPTVFGLSLPMSVEKTVFVEYETQVQTLSQEEAKKKAFEMYEKYKAGGEIHGEIISERVEGNKYFLDVEGTVKKDIALEVAVEVEFDDKKTEALE